MKILAFVDLHEDMDAFEKVKHKSKDADIILCLGDLTIFEHQLNKLLEELNALGKTVLMIPGNHESGHSLKEACSKYKNIFYINKGFFGRKNYLFLAYDGEGFKSVDNGFKETERIFDKGLKDKDFNKVILMLHAPPYNTEQDLIGTEHVGNKTYREYIEKIQPDLVFCGHIHEDWETEDKIGRTKVINPGPEGMIIDL